jgi:hypothetical protein
MREAPGFREFGGNSPTRNFYNLTTAFQEYYSKSSSSTYGANRYVLEASCNCTGANNSTGTANIVYIRIRFIDGYTDPGPGGPPFTGDAVDGTFTVTVKEKRAEAIGGLLPNSGNFIIQRPTYSIAAITGT